MGIVCYNFYQRDKCSSGAWERKNYISSDYNNKQQQTSGSSRWSGERHQKPTIQVMLKGPLVFYSHLTGSITFLNFLSGFRDLLPR